MTVSEKWHFFSVTGSDYLVLGYRPKSDNCMILGLDSLHIEDRKDLEFLANTPGAQKEPYLVNILVRCPYVVNKSWWEHVAHYVFFEPLYVSWLSVGGKLKGRISPTQYDVFQTAYKKYKCKQQELYENVVIEKSKTANDILYSPVG